MTTSTKKYTFFIGVDISRNELDFAVMQGSTYLFHKEINNITDDISIFINELKEIPGFRISRAVFCMEQTGIYSNHLLNYLKKVKGNAVAENPLQIKMSLGNVRGKHDKLDALRIAQYAYKNREYLGLHQSRRPVIEELAYLATLRSRMIAIKLLIETPLNEQVTFIRKGIHNQSVSLCQSTLSATLTDLAAIETYTTLLINNDERLKRLYTLITSVPSVGPVTARQIIIATNEFIDISCPKKFACYAGVAPFPRESGLLKNKTRVSKISDRKVRALLHTCAMGAIRYESELKAYYVRKTEDEGKPKMAVLNAVRYKLIARVFACVNEDRLYMKTYHKESSANVDDVNIT